MTWLGNTMDRVTQALLTRGYADAHRDLRSSARPRVGESDDLIFGRGVRFAGAGIGERRVGELWTTCQWARVRG